MGLRMRKTKKMGFNWDYITIIKSINPFEKSVELKFGMKMGLTLGWSDRSFGVTLRNHLDER